MHVEREEKYAKVWLEPVELAWNDGFGARELARIVAIVENHQHELLEAWHGFFSE